MDQIARWKAIYRLFRKQLLEAVLLGKERLEIVDVTQKNLDQLINLCVPPEGRDDRLFNAGKMMKRKWGTRALKNKEKIAKLAYLDSKLAGLIQYQLNSEEKLVNISCVFVPERTNSRKGIGRALVNSLIEDMKKTQGAFGNQTPLALVTYAFQVPEWYPQHKFYRKMGFRKAEGDDPLILYYPLKNGYVYKPKLTRYIPQQEDQKKALIFFDPSCPFCVRFSEKCKEYLVEAAPGVPIRMVNMSEEQEEVRKRGKIPFCSVNGKAVQTFFLDKENFQKEVRDAVIV